MVSADSKILEKSAARSAGLGVEQPSGWPLTGIHVGRLLAGSTHTACCHKAAIRDIGWLGKRMCLAIQIRPT